jgi:hypothetical protein
MADEWISRLCGIHPTLAIEMFPAMRSASGEPKRHFRQLLRAARAASGDSRRDRARDTLDLARYF